MGNDPLSYIINKVPTFSIKLFTEHMVQTRIYGCDLACSEYLNILITSKSQLSPLSVVTFSNRGWEF